MHLYRLFLPCNTARVESRRVATKNSRKSNITRNMLVHGQKEMRFDDKTSWALEIQGGSPKCICIDFSYLVIQLVLSQDKSRRRTVANQT